MEIILPNKCILKAKLLKLILFDNQPAKAWNEHTLILNRPNLCLIPVLNKIKVTFILNDAYLQY